MLFTQGVLSEEETFKLRLNIKKEPSLICVERIPSQSKISSGHSKFRTEVVWLERMQ